MSKKSILLDYSAIQLRERLKQTEIPAYVGDQCLDWVCQKHHLSFDKMANISKKNRALLAEMFDVHPFAKVEKVADSDDKAIKYILHLHDGPRVEMVVLKDPRYYSLCVSSQSGCPVDCKFCLTGVRGFKRQLSVAEILGQLLIAFSEGYPISRLIFMGMGEPLLNYEALIPALAMITSEKGFGIGQRKITVSTVGYLPGVKRLIKEQVYLNLAFSVGSTDPLIRRKIMPIQSRFSIAEMALVLHQYQGMHNRKLTLEYTLLKGVNESELEMKGLINLATYLDAKVNLINLNPHPEIPYQPVSSSRVYQLQGQLRKKGVSVTVRMRKGQDILAACGQLGGA
ncbi:MAG: 23S rRNA (adenine(2503)-C(2))-methyltransferase RlmN [Actinobacteria bacterium]|nr:23S rRNA (adenine(2503)-C(2))-methyltransferase RlmN [Actinomycetota bacterium]